MNSILCVNRLIGKHFHIYINLSLIIASWKCKRIQTNASDAKIDVYDWVQSNVYIQSVECTIVCITIWYSILIIYVRHSVDSSVIIEMNRVSFRFRFSTANATKSKYSELRKALGKETRKQNRSIQMPIYSFCPVPWHSNASSTSILFISLIFVQNFFLAS